MGITPWVQRTVAPDPVIQQPIENSTLHMQAQAPDASLVTVTSDWLKTQPLLAFQHRGRNVTSVGSSSASLLVVSLVNKTLEDAVPLSEQASQLLDLMMRAIAVQRNQYRTCAIEQAAMAADASADNELLPSVCGPQTRAILLLQTDIRQGDAGENDSQDRAGSLILDSSEVPVWRLTHPELLLQKPQLKRHAWETLKRLNASLG